MSRGLGWVSCCILGPVNVEGAQSAGFEIGLEGKGGCGSCCWDLCGSVSVLWPAVSVAVRAELTSLLLRLAGFAVVLILSAEIIGMVILGGVAYTIAVVAVYLAVTWRASELRIASTATNVTSAAASASA